MSYNLEREMQENFKQERQNTNENYKTDNLLAQRVV
jgi:hypothetical protein